MFTTPEMRYILDQINTIEDKYVDVYFPPYSREEKEALAKLHQMYQDAKAKAGL